MVFVHKHRACMCSNVTVYRLMLFTSFSWSIVHLDVDGCNALEHTISWWVQHTPRMDILSLISYGDKSCELLSIIPGKTLCTWYAYFKHHIIWNSQPACNVCIMKGSKARALTYAACLPIVIKLSLDEEAPTFQNMLQQHAWIGYRPRTCGAKVGAPTQVGSLLPPEHVYICPRRIYMPPAHVYIFASSAYIYVPPHTYFICTNTCC